MSQERVTTEQNQSDNQRARRSNPWGQLSYEDLIVAAINSSPEEQLSTKQICKYLCDNFPYFAERRKGAIAKNLKTSVRHKLSGSRRFIRVPIPNKPKISHWRIDKNYRRYQGRQKNRNPTGVDQQASRVGHNHTIVRNWPSPPLRIKRPRPDEGQAPIVPPPTRIIRPCNSSGLIVRRLNPQEIEDQTLRKQDDAVSKSSGVGGGTGDDSDDNSSSSVRKQTASITDHLLVNRTEQNEEHIYNQNRRHYEALK
ncbi:hypothetical protein ACOME3_002314 [Neoechinorhynchus agilis]